MAHTVLLKRSATSTAVPTGGQLAVGELAINTVDEKIFFKNSSGTVKSLSAMSDLTSNLVTLSTTQTISGAKTFSSNAVFSGDIAVNGGDITTSSASFNIAASATTINIATAANAAVTFSLGDSGSASNGSTFSLFGGAVTATYTSGKSQNSLYVAADRDFGITYNEILGFLGFGGTGRTLLGDWEGSGNANLIEVDDLQGTITFYAYQSNSYVFPSVRGSNGQVLTTNGSGTLSWATVSGGSKTYAVFTPLDNQPPASNYATVDTRNSIMVLDFDASTDESAVFVGVMPEGASLGSGLKIRISWMATSATSGTCRWGVQIERMNTDQDSDSFDTAATGGSTTNATSGIITTTEITITTIDSVAAGEPYRLKVYRDADGTSGTDDMTGDAELVAVEVRSAS